MRQRVRRPRQHWTGSYGTRARLVHELMCACGEQIDQLDCASALAPIERILNEATSAHQQLKIYHDSRAAGDEHQRALLNIVDWLKAATLDVAI